MAGQITLTEIPLNPRPETFTTVIGGTTYRFRTGYANTAGAGWYLDIMDGEGNPILCGLPLVPFTNLLSPYAYLGLTFVLLMTSATGNPPLFAELGAECKLYAGTFS